MLIDCIVGARPNFMKIAPLVRGMRGRGWDYRLIHTGQHYDKEMSDRFFEELGLPVPDINLGVGSGTHGRQTAAVMVKLEQLWLAEPPSLVMVVGDVNSTLGAALAAAKLNLPVAHLEAGYRSFDRSMPEEVNRVVVDHLADLLLAPTEDAVANLLAEGVETSKISHVGNIMVETLSTNMAAILSRGKCGELGLEKGRYAVATIHRPENVDSPDCLREIVSAFSKASLPVVLPLHPRTKARLEAYGLGVETRASLRFVDSMSYIDMMSAIAEASVVITDSGGLQEESCVLRVPCLTVRRNTERVATIACGANRLVSARAEKILAAIHDATTNRTASWDVPEKWDDKVSGRVIDAVRALLRIERQIVHA